MRKVKSSLTQEQLQGVILSLAMPEMSLINNSNVNDINFRHDYIVRLKVKIRSINIDFLNVVQRTFEQYRIESNIKEEESPTRKHPILSVTKRDSLIRLIRILPDGIPFSKSKKWKRFVKVLFAMNRDEHLIEKNYESFRIMIKGDKNEFKEYERKQNETYDSYRREWFRQDLESKNLIRKQGTYKIVPSKRY